MPTKPPHLGNDRIVAEKGQQACKAETEDFKANQKIHQLYNKRCT